MSALRLRFQPRPGFTVFALLGVAFLWSLCGWQVRRREEARVERELYAQRLLLPAFDGFNPPVGAAHGRVRATGTPDWDHVQRVLGRYMWLQPGMQLIVPLKSGERGILVDVGWVPEDEADAIIDRERRAGAQRTWSGIVRPFKEDPTARIVGSAGCWRAVSPIAMGREAALDVPDWVLVDGEGLGPDDDIPDRVPPISGWRTEPQQRPHGEYAFTWFSLGLTLVAVWVSSSFSGGPRPSGGLSSAS